MQHEYFSIAARWIFGLFYFAVGVWIVFSFFGLASAPQQPTPAAEAFMKALGQSQFIDPLLALTYLVGGGALLVRRTTPLGIALLTPVVVVIFFFHTVLSGQWIWGTINLAWLMALAWHFRTAFNPLWSHPASS